MTPMPEGELNLRTVRACVKALQAPGGGGDLGRVEVARTRDIEAYRAYLAGAPLEHITDALKTHKSAAHRHLDAGKRFAAEGETVEEDPT